MGAEPGRAREASVFRRYFRPSSAGLGLATGLGFLILFQQFGVTTFTTTKLVFVPLLSGVLGGFFGASGTAIGERRGVGR